MNVELAAGKYVIAVSGGVDSIALLHALSLRPDVELIVAHFDHGMRPDSDQDKQLVATTAQKYGYQFVFESVQLGQGTSEEGARTARYNFLQKVVKDSAAAALLTAHHSDDVLETIILNLIRGTSFRGLHSLKSTDTIKRPLLREPKVTILSYATTHRLQWREDTTNSDQTYLRNYIRRTLLPRFSDENKQELLEIGVKAHQITSEIDVEITNYLSHQLAPGSLYRPEFIALPHPVAREIMAVWLRYNGGKNISRQQLERLVLASKVGRTGSRVDVDAEHWLMISQTLLALRPRER